MPYFINRFFLNIPVDADGILCRLFRIISDVDPLCAAQTFARSLSFLDNLVLTGENVISV